MFQVRDGFCRADAGADIIESSLRSGNHLFDVRKADNSMQMESEIKGRGVGPMGRICVPWRRGGPDRGMLRMWRLAFGIVGLCLAAPAPAVEMDALYTVQVPFDAGQADAQNLAYQAALTEVLVRVTGTAAIAEWEQVAELFPNPGRFVLQFRPGADNTLIVSLDGTAIENVLKQAGVGTWGNDRPLTLAWIAVDWGQGEREIVAADDPDRRASDARSIDRNRLLRERITGIATYRGIPVLFPLLDIEDLESISFTDIWGGFDELLLQASARYQAETVLVGRIRAGSSAMNRWTWYLGGERMHWNGAPEEVIHLLADTLAARFKVDSRLPLETIRLAISGIDSVKAFGKVQRYMENLRGIDQVTIESVAGDRIIYRIRIQGGLERLQRALELNSMLQPVDPFKQDIEVVPFDDAGSQFDTSDDRDRHLPMIEYHLRSD